MESSFTLTLHGLTLAGIVVLLGFSASQHKVWVRMKDRINALWFKHCKDTGERFEPLDNGK